MNHFEIVLADSAGLLKKGTDVVLKDNIRLRPYNGLTAKIQEIDRNPRIYSFFVICAGAKFMVFESDVERIIGGPKNE